MEDHVEERPSLFSFRRWPHAIRVKAGRFSLTFCWKAVG